MHSHNTQNFYLYYLLFATMKLKCTFNNCNYYYYCYYCYHCYYIHIHSYCNVNTAAPN